MNSHWHENHEHIQALTSKFRPHCVILDSVAIEISSVSECTHQLVSLVDRAEKNSFIQAQKRGGGPSVHLELLPHWDEAEHRHLKTQ